MSRAASHKPAGLPLAGGCTGPASPRSSRHIPPSAPPSASPSALGLVTRRPLPVLPPTRPPARAAARYPRRTSPRASPSTSCDRRLSKKARSLESSSTSIFCGAEGRGGRAVGGWRGKRGVSECRPWERGREPVPPPLRALLLPQAAAHPLAPRPAGPASPLRRQSHRCPNVLAACRGWAAQPACGPGRRPALTFWQPVAARRREAGKRQARVRPWCIHKWARACCCSTAPPPPPHPRWRHLPTAARAPHIPAPRPAAPVPPPPLRVCGPPPPAPPPPLQPLLCCAVLLRAAWPPCTPAQPASGRSLRHVLSTHPGWRC